MIDRYTKAVLTIIAVALTVIAGEGLAPQTLAQSGPCGGPRNPCAITNETGDQIPGQPYPRLPIHVVVDRAAPNQ